MPHTVNARATELGEKVKVGGLGIVGGGGHSNDGAPSQIYTAPTATAQKGAHTARITKQSRATRPSGRRSDNAHAVAPSSGDAVAAIHEAVHDDGEGGVGEGGVGEGGAQPAASTRCSGGGCSGPARAAASRRPSTRSGGGGCSSGGEDGGDEDAAAGEAAIGSAATSGTLTPLPPPPLLPLPPLLLLLLPAPLLPAGAAAATAAAAAAATVAPPPPVSAAAAGVAISALGAHHDVADHRERCRSVPDDGASLPLRGVDGLPPSPGVGVPAPPALAPHRRRGWAARARQALLHPNACRKPRRSHQRRRGQRPRHRRVRHRPW
jgi:hypothetical protein